MATVKHYLVICVPRQNRVEPPVSAQDKGVFSFLNQKTYLRKYFKVFCVGYTSLDGILNLARMTFKRGVFFKNVPYSDLSRFDITPLSYSDFLEYCNASVLRSSLDCESSDLSTTELTPVYYVPSVLNYDPEEYAEAFMTKLCDCFCFEDFFSYEGSVFAAANGVCIVDPIGASQEEGITPDCFVNKEYKFTRLDYDTDFYVYYFRLRDRYISDCRKLSLFSRQDTVVCHEDDIPDDDDFDFCFAE